MKAVERPPAERRVSLFRNGRNQAVRILRDMELPGAEAIIRKDGDRLIIEPVKTGSRSLLEYLDSLEPPDFDFPEIGDHPTGPIPVLDDFDDAELVDDGDKR